MTEQTPERIILDGRPHALNAEPLYRWARRRRLKPAYPDGRCTSNWRGYVGTWEIHNGRLYLVHLCWAVGMDEIPILDELRRKLLRAAGASAFPIHAHWVDEVLHIPLGRRLIYSHHGWSSWFEQKRVLHVRGGEVVRDRVVDTRAILEWWLKRHPEYRDRIEGEAPGQALKPLVWFEDEDKEGDDWAANWWSPDYQPVAWTTLKK